MFIFSKLIAWILGLMAVGSAGSAISFSGVKDSLNIFDNYLKDKKDNFKGKKIKIQESFSSLKELQEKMKSIKDYLDGKSNSPEKLEDNNFKEVVKDLKGWINEKKETKQEYENASKKIDNFSSLLEERFRESPDKLEAKHFQTLLEKYISKKDVTKLTPFLLPIVNAINDVDKELNNDSHAFQDLNSSKFLKEWEEEYKQF